MKTDDELRIIAIDLANRVKMYVKSQGVFNSVSDVVHMHSRLKDIGKEANEQYLTFRQTFELSDEENKKVDKMFGRIMIVGARKAIPSKKEMKKFKEMAKDGKT